MDASHGAGRQHVRDPDARRLPALGVHGIDNTDRLSGQRFGEPPVGMVSE
jgi:hypothetical protein